jgi:nitrogenase-associated protein
MASVEFYGKPGCINNEKQKRLLRAAGHEVIEHSILSAELSQTQLRAFFGSAEVAKWFNYTAPAIKSGAVDPQSLTESAALELMASDRLLIKRPLMRIGERLVCGFDTAQLDELIGLEAVEGQSKTLTELKAADLVTCPQLKQKC